jgi:CDP-diacylglycerol--glycerol-3-phosphate 3-phosphatidyltransferase
MANALTAARVLLTLPFAFLMTREGAPSAMLAALVLAAAVATDVLDGRVARRRGTSGSLGAVFDHGADCLFVTAGLAAGAMRGAFPWILPVLVAAAFVQYVADSYWVYRERALHASTLGRWNGILYFVPLAGDMLVRIGLRAIHPVVIALAWLLVVSTVISMGERLWTVMRASPRAPGWPAGGRGDRRPR